MNRKYKTIIQDDTTKCAICGQKKKLDWHHIRCGNQTRERSENWGLMITLCRDCHTKLHSNAEIKEEWQEKAQERFMLLYGYDVWMKEFKKDYFWGKE